MRKANKALVSHSRSGLQTQSSSRFALMMSFECFDDPRHAGAERSFDHDAVTGSRGSEHVSFELRRGRRVAASPLRGKRLPQGSHQRTAAEREIDIVFLDAVGEAAVQLAAA